MDLPLGTENRKDAPWNEEWVKVKIITEEKVFREYYIDVDKRSLDEVYDDFDKTIEYLQESAENDLELGEEETVIDYELH